MANETVRFDPHSHYSYGQPKMRHVRWHVEVDFAERVLNCTVLITFDKSGLTTLDLRGIYIKEVKDNRFIDLDFSRIGDHPVIGDGIQFVVPENRMIHIAYKTSPTASGLQWLTKEQTSGKRHPFMFTQGQCLHTRSFLPCQGTPEVRFTFDATIVVPKELRALMGASHISRSDWREFEGRVVERWKMQQPIPAYLVSLAVGDLEERDITDRCRVYAEKEMVEAAKAEFKDIGKIMEAAERLAGPYEWGRFDMLVLPPSFPYGGMENPRLAFLSPTIVTGTGSMAFVIAHELAHAWTGNLITNASWGDFWLNEGWTTYFEHRILEEIYGKEEALLHMAIQERDLKRDMDRFFATGKQAWTKLHVELTQDDDPDDIFSIIPYVKGAMFVQMLEEAVGRARFDKFIRSYIEVFKFTSIETAYFLDFVDCELPGVLDNVHHLDWWDGEGVPINAPRVKSQKASVALTDAQCNTVPIDSHAWSPNQWVLYLQSLSRELPASFAESLLQFGLAHAINIEVRWSYLLFCLETKFMNNDIGEAVERLLTQVGRMKFILPIYRALSCNRVELTLAQQIFKNARSGYHPIAIAQVEKIFKEADEKLLTQSTAT
ncbi:M1 family metallopeptidase [Candidatus Uhrbacteria bacterium]|nr:M1 family metallopeptidase [Candidatus Uhrbacteria bacterium]